MDFLIMSYIYIQTLYKPQIFQSRQAVQDIPEIEADSGVPFLIQKRWGFKSESFGIVGL